MRAKRICDIICRISKNSGCEDLNKQLVNVLTGECNVHYSDVEKVMTKTIEVLHDNGYIREPTFPDKRVFTGDTCGDCTFLYKKGYNKRCLMFYSGGEPIDLWGANKSCTNWLRCEECLERFPESRVLGDEDYAEKA
jgi:hypothetical protein